MKKYVIILLFLCSMSFSALIEINNKNLTLSGVYDRINITHSVIVIDELIANSITVEDSIINTNSSNFNSIFLKDISNLTMNNSNANNLALYPEYTGNVIISNSNIGTIMYPESCHGIIYLNAINITVENNAITGQWLNNNSFSIDIRGEIPLGNLRAIPEPMTAVIILFGSIFIRRRKI